MKRKVKKANSSQKKKKRKIKKIKMKDSFRDSIIISLESNKLRLSSYNYNDHKFIINIIKNQKI